MFEKQIKKGIEFLNKKIPGWYNQIILSRLNMDEPYFDREDKESCGCIGAQLNENGEFFLFTDDLDLKDAYHLKSKKSVIHFGLDISEGESNDSNYVALTKEWKAAIKDLKNKSKLRKEKVK